MSDNNLYEASAQWANRPDDERYESIDALLEATRKHKASAVTSTALLGDLRVEAQETNLTLVGKTDTKATLTHYSFWQLSNLVGAPAGFLRKLPPTLAAQNINHLLKAKSDGDPTDKLNLLFHRNGHLVSRAVNTDSYDRVWNCDLAERVKRLADEDGWRVPPARPARSGQKGTRPATEADILPGQGDFGLAVEVGDPIAPAGLYASDHDMFAFLVKPGTVVEDGEQALNIGAFLWNSEVGASALGGKLFIYDNVCGNHIVWGVSAVSEFSVRHVKGENVREGNTLRNGLRQWRTLTATTVDLGGIEGGIKSAREKVIAATKDDVLDAVFKFGKAKGLNRLTRSTIDAAYTVAAETPRYGSPRSVWGMVNGLTEVSQKGSLHTDSRNELDVQAGRVMEMAF